MSYLQIYQEKIYDLLNSTSKIELSLREHPVKGEQIYVTCTWVFVHVRFSLGVAWNTGQLSERLKGYGILREKRNVRRTGEVRSMTYVRGTEDKT